jgi:N-acyl amino acid synthase of PEP-CTERM/exosortase system
MDVGTLLGIRKGDLLVPHFSFKRAQYEAITPEFLNEICSLRYEVYCLECGFLDPKDYEHGIECDEYEGRSTHVAAYNLSDEIVGTVRLVQARDDNQQFPWQSHCVSFENFVLPPPTLSAEVSRLVVHKRYRRRSGDNMAGVSQEIETSQKTAVISAPPCAACAATNTVIRKRRRSNTPQILLGMYRELYRYSRANGVRYWYAAMERHLANSLGKMGFPFKPIGPATDYYGPVTPYLADLDEVVESLRERNPLLCAWFHDEPISRWLLLQTFVQMQLGALRNKH